MTQDIKIRMTNPAMAFQKPLEEYINYLEKMNERSVALLPKLAVPGVHYISALHDVRGCDAMMAVFRARLEAGAPRLVVQSHTWALTDNTVYLRWQSRGSNDVVTNGIAEIMFSYEGLVMSHHDFSDALYQLPPKPTFWSRLKKRYS